MKGSVEKGLTEKSEESSTLVGPKSVSSKSVSWSPYLRQWSDAKESAVVFAGSDRRLSNWTFGYTVEPVKPIKESLSLEVAESFIDDEMEEYDEEEEGFLARIEKRMTHFFVKRKRILKFILIALLLILYFMYFGYAVYLKVQKDGFRDLDFCHGCGFLILITSAFVLFYSYTLFISKIYVICLKPRIQKYLNLLQSCFADKTVKRIIYGMVSLIFIIFLIFDGVKHKEKLRSSVGVFVFTLVCFIFSKHRTKVPWAQVYWGLVIQYAFALLIFYWGIGEVIIRCISRKIQRFVETSNEGALIIFDYLVNGTNITVYDIELNKETKYVVTISWIVGFKIVPAVLFFSCILSILFYYGILQWFVVNLATMLQKTMGTTAAESINSAANIFLGATEAPLIIRPFLAQMTKSELHTILATGFATIAGTMFTVYVTFGLSPVHLMSAAFMSAPAALSYSKLLYPETETSTSTVTDIKLHKGVGQDANVFAAAASGTASAIPLASTIVANLITFISILKLINVVVSWLGSLIGIHKLTLEFLLGKLFVPIVYLMGIEWESCDDIGELIGLKVIISEFIAYNELLELEKKRTISKRDLTISVYALCGFSNVSAIGMQLGTLGALAPERMDDMASVVIRAFGAGLMTSFLTACIAGSLIGQDDYD